MWSLVVVVAGLGAVGVWYIRDSKEREQQTQEIRSELPSLPYTGDWPEAFASALNAANDAVLDEGLESESLPELAMLFHANAFLDEASVCYTFLNERDPHNARWAYYLADIRLSTGDLQSAEKLLTAVIDLDPAYIPAQLRLGEALFKSGNSGKARDVFQQTLALEPGNPYAMLGLARIRLQDDDEEVALALLSDLSEINPEFSAGYTLAAQVLDRRGEERKAEVARALFRERGRHREAPDPWMDTVTTRCYDISRLTVLADQNIATRQFERAVDLLERAENLAPENSQVHLFRGFAYAEMGERDSAINRYRSALRYGGDPVAINGELARLFQGLGDIEKAMSAVRAGLKENPKAPELHGVLGELLIEQDRAAEAETHLRSALEEDSAYLPALRNLARVLWEAGNDGEAMEYFEEVRRLAPLDFQSRAFLAQHYIEKGELAKVEQPLREAMDLEPENAELQGLALSFLVAAGDNQMGARDYLSALDFYTDALAGDSDNIDLRLKIGLAYMGMEDYMGAIPSIEKYTDGKPEDVRGWMILGDVLWEERQFEKARGSWRKASIVARGMGAAAEIHKAIAERLALEIPAARE